MARLYAAFSLTLNLCAGTSEADPLSFTADPDFLIQTWNSRAGLPEDSATAVTQTPDGYLWCGTFAGLVRFNGSEFKALDFGDTPGMPDPRIVNLYHDKKGRMWVSSLSGLGVMEAGHWRAFSRDDGWPGDFVRTFAERENGDLLLTSFDGQVAEFTGGKFTPLAPPVESGKGCFGYADETGRWWVIQAKFTGWWDGAQWTPAATAYGAKGGGRARDGGMWLLSGEHLVKIQHGVETARRIISDNVGDFWSLYEDSHENVWICTGDSGLLRVTPSGRTKRWTMDNGLSALSVRCAFEDREGNLWIGTNNGGLQQFTPKRFQTFAPANGMPPTVVSSVSSGPSGNVWAATYGEGLFKVEGAELTRVSLPPDSGIPRFLQSVLEDRRGRLWVGTYGRGLFVIEDGKVRTFPAEETGGANVIALFEDSRGAIWISGGQSAALFQDGGLHPLNTAEGLPTGTVAFFAEDHEGSIWAAHKEGIFRRSGGKFAKVTDAAGITVPDVTSLCPEGGGAMWVSTSSGLLMRWQNGKMKTVNLPAEQARSIRGVTVDGLGWYWIATDRGILRIGVNELNAAADSSRIAAGGAFFDRFDGLPATGFSNVRQPVSIQSTDKRLWFASSRGLVMTQPQGFQLNTVPPRVHIESFVHSQPASVTSAENQTELSAPFPSRIVLPPERRRLEFRCAALNFKSSGNARCQMMLEGLDTTWRDMPQRVVTFYDLAPNDYTFRFRAANADGIWSESDARLAFTVSPRFWETLWFRGGCVLLLLIAGGSVAAWITRLRHLHLEEALEIQRQRGDIAHLSRVAALNELSGSLAHELNQPLAIILSNAQAGLRLLQRRPPAVDELREILTDVVAEDRRAGEVIHRLRGMLKRGESALHPEFIPAIVEDVLTLIRSDLISRGVTVITDYAPDSPPVMADRIQIQQVLLNLITNACDSMASNERHLRRLKVATTARDAQVHVTVSDEGCGLPPGDPEQVFNAFFSTKDYGLGMGLAICRSIVQAHHGLLSARPNTPRGTSFRLTLPVAPNK